MSARDQHRIDPRPHIPRDVSAIGRQYASPNQALEAGNYPVALALAGTAEPETLACATIMCGAVLPGLTLLGQARGGSPATRLYQGFALWCLERREDARRVLGTLAGTEAAARAEALDRAIAGPPLDVVLLSMPDSDKAAPFEAAPGFRVFPASLGPADFGATLGELLGGLGDGARPAMVVNIDAFGPYLPWDAGAVGPPLVSWSSDHDFFIATRYHDFARSAVVIANTASEHDQIGAIHQTRIAAFPAHHSYGWSTVFPPSFPHKDVDILFTGQAFTPTMRDKAQFLFRLATIDRAGARIAIHDDFLEDEKYVTSLASAKFVTTYLRYTGGVQTRATDALRRSALVLSNDQDWAAGRLGGALDGLICVDPAAPEGDILARLDGQDGGSAPGPGRPALDKGFGQFFWPSPARESRFLKFCFFQTLLADGKGAPGGEGAGAIPVELGGYSPERGVGVYSAISKANLAAPRKTPAHMNFAGAAAFYGAILLKDNQKMGRMALKIFRAGLEAFPDALAMRFNYARALWLFGIKVEACAQFEQVASDQAAQFDAWRDALLSHRVQPLAEMFPYGDYYRATARALGRGDGDFSEARRMIRGGARSFLGLAAMEQGRERPALDHLRGAIADCPINFPAYRLLCVGLARQREQGAELLDAFYRAVNLYPPYLSELLPIGVAAEINRGRDGAALELIRKWIMFQLRRLDGKGMPFPVPAQSLETALHYRGRLEHWTAEALALIVAENSTVGPLPMA